MQRFWINVVGALLSISLTTSVMKFNYRDFEINLLDTPGHQDFSEDTYRTLTAVDSAVMVNATVTVDLPRDLFAWDALLLDHEPVDLTHLLDRVGHAGLQAVEMDVHRV